MISKVVFRSLTTLVLSAVLATGLFDLRSSHAASLVLPAFSFSAELDINTITEAQYAGAVSMAMEGMRLVYGDMSETEEAAFEAEWQPLFAHPVAEVIEYLNRLNPLLARFIAIRDTLDETLGQYETIHFELSVAVAENDDASMRESLLSNQFAVAVIERLEQQLNQVIEEILGLGELPDAATLRADSRRRHREALSAFAPAGPSQGQWVMVDRTLITHHADDAVNREPASRPLDASGRPGAQRPPEFLKARLLYPQQALALDDEKAVLGFVNRPGSEGWRVHFEWTEPPLQIQPDQRVNVMAHARLEFLGHPDDHWRGKPRTISPNGMLRTLAFRTREHAPYPIQVSDCKFYAVGEAAAEASVDLENQLIERWLTPRESPAEEPGTAPFQAPGPYLAEHYPPYQPIDPAGQLMLIEVMGEIAYRDADRLLTRPNDNCFRVQYLYQWEPEGIEIAAWERGTGSAEDRRTEPSDTSDTSDTPGASAPSEAADAFEPTAAAVQAQRDFHKTNIQYFEDNLQSLNQRIAQSADISSRESMRREVIWQRNAIQREKDAIASLETGQFVRTRTELDALNFHDMLEQGRREADDALRVKRVIERMPRLIALADPEDRERLTEFFYQQLQSTPGQALTAARANQLAGALGNQVAGSLMTKSAAADLAAIQAAQNLERAENVKAFTDGYLMVASTFLPVYHAYAAPNLVVAAMRAKQASQLYTVYQGVTGYVEGGPSKAFTAVASSYNTVTKLAYAGMEGYQSGVLGHLEAYAANPQGAQLDEHSAGMSGAIWGVGKEAVKSYVLKKTIGAMMPPRVDSPAVRKLPTIAEQIEEGNFRSRQFNGHVKVRLFQQHGARLAEAGRAGAPREEILQLRGRLNEAYTVVKSDYFAKMHIRALERSGDHRTTHYYNSIERNYRQRMTTEFTRRMAELGFNEALEYRTFSNASSRGRVGIDLDFGVAEPPRTIVAGGRHVPNPAHLEWRRSITQRAPDGTVVRRSPQQLQTVGSEVLMAVYEDIHGRPPGEAMVSFTSTYHPEAYRDVTWLGRRGMAHAPVLETDAAWVGQASDVTRFKINHLPQGHPSLGHYGVMQERMRGLVKDFDTKIEPMLDAVPPSRRHLAVHMRELRNVMHRFAQDEIGPIEADHRLRELTGGDGVEIVGDRMSSIMVGLRDLIAR